MSTSTDDDIELKDMVTQLLDSSGILGKMKAQLRAHVYTTLESAHVPKHSKLSNQSLAHFLSSTSGRLIFCLVREFLEFFELDFTLSVFDPETKIGKDLRYRGRSKLIDSLGLTELVDKNSPLLSEIMRLSKVSVLKSESPTLTEMSEDDNTSNQPSLAQDHSNNKSGYKDYKDCIPVDDEDSLTPSLSLHLDQPHNLPQQQPPPPSHPQDKVDGFNRKEVDVRKLNLADSDKLSLENDVVSSLPIAENIGGSCLLGDLPPLGSSISSLGDLPPLGVAKRGDLPPLTISKGGELSSLSGLTENTKTNMKQSVQQNNINTEKTVHQNEKLLKVGSEKDSIGEYSVSEDIAEDLDSFSSQSNAEQFTKEEIVINSDSSLRADHVESL